MVLVKQEVRLINHNHQVRGLQNLFHASLHLQTRSTIAMPNAQRPGKLPDLSGPAASAVQTRKPGHARVTIAPGPNRLGFPAPLKPVEYDHSSGPERVIKLCPDLPTDSGKAKARLYPFFVTALIFRQGADNI